MNGDLNRTFHTASSTRREEYVLTVRTGARVGASGSCDSDKSYCLINCARQGEGLACEQACMRKWRDCTGIRI